ncbi:MAG: hypothetical protein ABJM26_13270 [Anderseniella sp.]
MHVTLQRARQHSRGRFFTGAALNFVGAGLLLFLATSPALTAQRTDADPLITGSLPAPSANVPLELRIEITKPGSEGIRLDGRLSEDGGLITKPVTWKLLRTLGNGAQGGDAVYSDAKPVADIPLEPGNYRIEARYGSVSAVKPIVLTKGQHLGLTFVFNVGGLRTLSTLGNEPLPQRVRAVHRAYAVNGSSSGKLIATSDQQGGLMRLGAGTYRLESEIEPGNTVTHTEVTIKPGILTSLNLDHEAGIAVINAPDGVPWSVGSREKNWHRSGIGPGMLTLAPGRYTYNDGDQTRTIIVVAGKRTRVRAGN